MGDVWLRDAPTMDAGAFGLECMMCFSKAMLFSMQFFHSVANASMLKL